MNRFEYVKFDNPATVDLEEAKDLVLKLEHLIGTIESTDAGRAKALALTKLEEAYMWIGKALRDDQLARGTEEKV